MTAQVIAGLLLAAGGGARLGRPKALVELDGQLLVDRAAILMIQAGLAPRIAVLGASARDVHSAADLSEIDVITNSDWQDGMASSLRVGLQALTGLADAVVVLLVDQPMIGVEAINRLVECWHSGATAAVATYEGEPRNPVLLDCELWPDIITSVHGDVGARSFLRSHPEIVTHVPCDGTGKAVDIDTRADLFHIRRTHRSSR